MKTRCTKISLLDISGRGKTKNWYGTEENFLEKNEESNISSIKTSGQIQNEMVEYALPTYAVS